MMSAVSGCSACALRIRDFGSPEGFVNRGDDGVATMTIQRLILVCLILASIGQAAGAGTLTLGIQSSSPQFVEVDDLVTVEIRATFDEPLTALAFEISLSGSAAATIESRTLGPLEANGMTILSPVSQTPFIDSLPHSSDGGTLREILFDDDYNGAPGGPTDGVDPGANVLIETLDIRLTSAGTVSITLSAPQGAITRGSPQGVLFEQAQVDPGAEAVLFVACGNEDCNNNTTGDICDIASGASEDCNANDVPDECEPDCNENGEVDECEVLAGAAEDCNADLIPDECQPDCNENGTPDVCDILEGFSRDCNANGVPDECDFPGGVFTDCNENGIADYCDISLGIWGDCDTDGVPDVCQIAAGTAQDCDSDLVLDACEIASGEQADCNANGIPDNCEADCDNDGIPDACEVPPIGTSPDCNGNFVPDECDIQACPPGNLSCQDCNANGIPDGCDIASGLETDCNLNGGPDACDISSGRSRDCQPDNIPDECQIDRDRQAPDPPYFCDPAMTACSPDIDSNGVPDECQDCNDNSIFDPCEIGCPPFCDPENCGSAPELDCSSNGIPDDCDVDCNNNGIPDTCECFFGDYDRDGDTDLLDFAAFQNCVNTNDGPVGFDCDCAFDLYPLAGGPGIGDDDTTAADYPSFEAYLTGPAGGPHTPCWDGHPYAPRRGGGG